MDTSRIFYVNTDKQTFTGSHLWSEDMLRQELGNEKWEVYWTHYADVNPELSSLHRLEGELTADEIFSLIDYLRDHVGVLHLHLKADEDALFSFDTDYWISPTSVSISTKTADKLSYIHELMKRVDAEKCGQLYRAMRLSEVFELNFFEELVCTRWCNEETFLIHKEDIEPDGKFHQFRQYTIDKFSKEFGVLIKCH